MIADTRDIGRVAASGRVDPPAELVDDGAGGDGRQELDAEQAEQLRQARLRLWQRER